MVKGILKSVNQTVKNIANLPEIANIPEDVQKVRKQAKNVSQSIHKIEITVYIVGAVLTIVAITALIIYIVRSNK